MAFRLSNWGSQGAGYVRGCSGRPRVETQWVMRWGTGGPLGYLCRKKVECDPCAISSCEPNLVYESAFGHEITSQIFRSFWCMRVLSGALVRAEGALVRAEGGNCDLWCFDFDWLILVLIWFDFDFDLIWQNPHPPSHTHTHKPTHPHSHPHTHTHTPNVFKTYTFRTFPVLVFKTYTFRTSPYWQIWFRKLENLVNMLFLVEVNTKHRTNLNKLCMKNTTPHVGTMGQNFSSQVKSKTYLKHYLHSPV